MVGLPAQVRLRPARGRGPWRHRRSSTTGRAIRGALACAASLGALVLAVGFVVSGDAGARPALASLSGPLDGVFSVQPGSCSLVGPPSGSYVELEEHGVPVPNPSSPCPLTSSFYTPLRTGTIGLVSGAYQLDPVPTFNHSGGSEANAIVTPVAFLGVGFGLATTCADQQHHGTPTGACAAGRTGFPVPQLYAEPIGTGGCKVSLTAVTSALDLCLYGNLEGLGVTYNGTPGGTCADNGGNGCYDVGAATAASLSVTSCGSAPVGGCSLSGTLDPVTDAYTLMVTSTIVGTSFNGAKAVFSFSGTYRPGVPRTTSSSTGSSPSSTAPTTTPTPAASAAPAPASGISGQAMDGVFHLAGGACAGAGPPSGSWVQLGLGGTPVKNPNSSCDGGAYTPITQGTTGLETGTFEPDPTPTFDSAGNSLADAIMTPTKFLGTDFGAATDPQNMQDAPSGPAVFPPPSAVLSGDVIHANLSSVNFTYNGPANGTCASGNGDGCYAVGSADVTGSYDPTSHAYTLAWTATIVGGAFNNATASFHLTGTFTGTISASQSNLSTAGANVEAVAASSGAAPATVTVPSTTAALPVTTGPLANAMEGTFTIAGGACAGAGPPSGSWVQLGKGGAPIPNPNSSCDGGAYTPITQGTTGLETGTFEPDPTPTFDSAGNSLADAIMTPTKFLGTDFGAATDPQNMQDAPSGPAVFPPPSAVLSGDVIHANLSSVNFTYNGPANGTCASGNGDGCYAVGSADVTGSYDPTSHAYTLAWTATIVGGAFNGATASFHLTGTFTGRIVTVAAGSLPGAGAPVAAGASAGAPRTSATTTSPGPTRSVATTAALAGRGPWPDVLDAVVLAAAAAIVVATVLDGRRRRRPRGEQTGGSRPTHDPGAASMT
jgi:hypothetical protein